MLLRIMIETKLFVQLGTALSGLLAIRNFPYVIRQARTMEIEWHLHFLIGRVEILPFYQPSALVLKMRNGKPEVVVVTRAKLRS